MTKDKTVYDFMKDEFPIEPIDVSTHSESPKFIPVEMKVYYRHTLWSGVLPTFRCEICGHCDPSKDEMILHVLTHVHEMDRDGLLEILTKE